MLFRLSGQLGSFVLTHNQLVSRENSSFDQFNLWWHRAFVRLEEGKGETAVDDLYVGGSEVQTQRSLEYRAKCSICILISDVSHFSAESRKDTAHASAALRDHCPLG